MQPVDTIRRLQHIRQPGAQDQILKDTRTIAQLPIKIQCHHDRCQTLIRLLQQRNIGPDAQGIGTGFGYLVSR